jgi:hypothetical protein
MLIFFLSVGLTLFASSLENNLTNLTSIFFIFYYFPENKSRIPYLTSC